MSSRSPAEFNQEHVYGNLFAVFVPKHRRSLSAAPPGDPASRLLTSQEFIQTRTSLFDTTACWFCSFPLHGPSPASFLCEEIQLICSAPQYKLPSEGVTHTASLTFDLTADQDDPPKRNRKKGRTL
ncbi:hypothetical protein EYF80_056652 [Liparis tanakae]|uniref:Uncharacterized protein n=1 Tax=Liparis tanakae TaxID=230148 RepID=A0A4Z2EXX4_9TELE|nr:hypothetical protein EYF80_056652 [Liparis tanakae]